MAQLLSHCKNPLRIDCALNHPLGYVSCACPEKVLLFNTEFGNNVLS